MRYRMINGAIQNVGNIGGASNINQKKKEIPTEGNFKNLLREEVLKGAYKVSKHAEERLKGVNLNEKDIKTIEKGFKIAEDKGSKNSLMLYKDLALIASIENRTVITAITRERARENIYTNIDSVVVL